MPSKLSTLTAMALDGLIALAPPAHTSPYTPPAIRDLAIVEVADQRMWLGDRWLEYTLSYEASSPAIEQAAWNSHPPSWVMQTIEETWPTILLLLADRGIQPQDCRDDYNLKIFVVDAGVLGEEHRFPEMYDRPSFRGLSAYYSSTPDVERNSVIILADIQGESRGALLAHELGHYFWDRMCLGSGVWHGDTEDFAQTVQRAFRLQ